MTTGMRPVTVGVLGSGNIAPELVCDALNAHFSFGPVDQEGYFGPSDKYALTVFIPAGTITSPGVHTVWEWAIRCELAYQVLWDQTGNTHTVDILGNVDNPKDITMVDDIGAAMVDHLSQSENPMLLLLSQDEQFDPGTAEAAARALRAGVPCYDLARALLEVTWRHLPDHEPPEQPEFETGEDGQMALAVASGGADVALSAQEAAAISAAFAEAEEFMAAVCDVVVARMDSLRQSLIRGRSLLAPKPEPAVEGAEPKKTRLEIFNPQTNEWEPAGRGRPPKDAQKRRVPA